jgi:hypothetical protein
MTYNAYIDVKEYDDDFVLIVDKWVLVEGRRSVVFVGTTPAEALGKLLAVTTATDRHCTLSALVPAPEGYHHVRHVRRMLNDMQRLCERGEMPPPEMLHWGGNWDVTFHVSTEDLQRRNKDRAERASAALKAYHDYCHDAGPHDHDEVMGDLMCDLMRLLRQQGEADPTQVIDELVVTANINFDAEEAEEKPK